MDSVIVLPACGFYQELYIPAPEHLLRPKLDVDESGILDANNMFWSEILSTDQINKTVDSILKKVNQSEHVPLPYRAIAADPMGFSSRILLAKIKIADHAATLKEFYSYVETINIYCSLYAKTFSEELEFNIQNGWLLSEDSAQDIYESCLSGTKNPYFEFIKMRIIPPLVSVMPKLIFLYGRPGYFAFALARLLKLEIPTVCICITRHSSEYYSMNKIDFLLKDNHFLFSVFDAVILDHFASTEAEIIDAISRQRPIDGIKNLVCRTTLNEIRHTGYRAPISRGVECKIRRRPWFENETLVIPPYRVADVHLLPDIKCPWNKCNFCGINQKYHFGNSFDEVYVFDSRIAKLRELVNQGVTHIWFVDEALTHTILRKVAEFFIQESNEIIWQSRSRISQELLEDGLPELLARSGLRELRLGLESGSYAVLRSMNKFDSSFSFSLVEELCHEYSDRGISIHFPVIIGFPGETDADRNATYTLLTTLTEKYPLVTFNINIFGLDISSNIFHKWSEFGIQSLSFPCDPAAFIGNILQWRNSSFSSSTLFREQTQFMRENLYPWMPSRSFTPPHILYRLSETIRNTLFWKASAVRAIRNISTNDRVNTKMQVTDITIFRGEDKNLYYIYSWNSHHYMLGDSSIVNLIEAFQAPETLENALKIVSTQFGDQYAKDDTKILIERLLYYQYLTITEMIA